MCLCKCFTSLLRGCCPSIDHVPHHMSQGMKKCVGHDLKKYSHFLFNLLRLPDLSSLEYPSTTITKNKITEEWCSIPIEICKINAKTSLI